MQNKISKLISDQILFETKSGSIELSTDRSGKFYIGGYKEPGTRHILTIDPIANCVTIPCLNVLGTISASYYVGVTGSGGGSPGAPDTSVQFNNLGSFAGSANLTYDSAAARLTGVQASFTHITGSLAGNASTVTNGIYTTTIASNATTGVTAGAGLTGGGTVGSLTVNVGAGDGITVNADDIAVNSTVIRTTGNQTLGGAKTFSSYITGSITGSDAKFTTITGSHAGSGVGLTNITASGITNFTNDVRAQFSAGNNITIVSGVISAVTGSGSGVPGGTNQTVQFNSGSTFSGSTQLTYNYTTNVLSGTTAQFTTITGSLTGNASTVTNGVYTTTISSHATTAVTAGAGLTGGGTVGSLTVNVGAGDGITVNADDIAVNSTVIRTTGNQTLAGAKTFSNYITGSITGSDAKFTTITGSHAGSGAGLTNIPNGALTNSTVTVGSTSISLGSTATTIQGISVITGSIVTGSTALFTNITGSHSGSGAGLFNISATAINNFGNEVRDQLFIFEDTGDELPVVGYISGGLTTFSNLSHKSSNKTTYTNSLVTRLDITTPTFYLTQSVSSPLPVSGTVNIYNDSTNNVKAVKPDGSIVRLDAIEVAQTGSLVSTRKRINFINATIVDDSGGNQTNITISTGSATGDVVGPVGSTDNSIVRFNGITGKLIQGSLATIDDQGRIYASTGSAVSPSFSFDSNQTYGIYLSSSNSIGISTAGTPIIRMWNTGSYARLNLNDANGSIIELSRAGELKGGLYTDPGGLYIQTNTDPLLIATNGFERVRVASDGNVGIGIPSANVRLHVSRGGSTALPATAGSTTGSCLYLTTSDDLYGMMFGVSGSGVGWIQQQRRDANTQYSLLLNPISGNVGIGYNSSTPPAQKLTVDGNVRLMNGGYTEYLGNDASTVISSSNLSAGAAAQFYIKHKLGDMELGNYRGNLLFSSGSIGINTTATQAGFAKFVVRPAANNLIALTSFNSTGSIISWNDAGSSNTLRLAGSPIVFTGNGGSGAEAMRLNASGDLSLGTGNPAYRLDIEDSVASGYVAQFFNNNSTGNSIIVAAGTGSGTRTLISFRDISDVSVGAITFLANTVSYGAFTGEHPGFIANIQNDYIYGNIVKIDSTETIGRSVKYNVSRTSSSYDKSVMGIFAGLESLQTESGSFFSDGYSIYSLGDGHVMVCNEGGNIEIGDYLCSSNTVGVAMKQDDDILHSYTVAKATQNISWNEQITGSILISCTYHSA